MGKVRAALGLAALLLLVGCEADRPRPNVVLITIDTLRADRVSAYGHTPETTPTLDALAREGARFDNAYASSSWTAPSVASLLTSLQPASHGVEHGHVESAETRTAEGVRRQEALADGIALWPELLAGAGYRSFGIAANAHLDPRFGFAQGFDRYRCVGFAELSAVESVLEGWAGEIARSAPWFLWLHLFDPHAPYLPNADWIRRQRPAFRGVPEPLASVRMAAQYAALGVTKGSADFELVNLLYEGEIARTDAAIGRMLERVGLGRHDLAIVTSDHGEAFLEHGRFGHGSNLYEEVVRVPLILRMPDRAFAGRVVEAPVAGIDVLPTVLDLLDLDAPVSLQGRSLVPLLRGEAAEPRDVVTALERFAPLSSGALRRGSWKYLRRYADGRQALYDLASDPGEQRNRLAERPDLARELAAALEAARAAQRRARIEPRLEPLRPDELEQLRALGYTEAE